MSKNIKIQGTDFNIKSLAGDVEFNLAGNANITGNTVMEGDLTVTGTTTTVDSETLTIADNLITLNSNVIAAPTEDAGIEIERGTSNNVLLNWNETLSTWEVTLDSANPSGTGPHEVIHRGLTGAGSGLNADTVDGYHGAEFAALSEDEIITGEWTHSSVNPDTKVNFDGTTTTQLIHKIGGAEQFKTEVDNTQYKLVRGTQDVISVSQADGTITYNTPELTSVGDLAINTPVTGDHFNPTDLQLNNNDDTTQVLVKDTTFRTRNNINYITTEFDLSVESNEGDLTIATWDTLNAGNVGTINVRAEYDLKLSSGNKMDLFSNDSIKTESIATTTLHSKSNMYLQAGTLTGIAGAGQSSIRLEADMMNIYGPNEVFIDSDHLITATGLTGVELISPLDITINAEENAIIDGATGVELISLLTISLDAEENAIIDGVLGVDLISTTSININAPIVQSVNDLELVIKSGDATVLNDNAQDLTLAGGTATGTGADGIVKIGLPTHDAILQATNGDLNLLSTTGVIVGNPSATEGIFAGPEEGDLLLSGGESLGAADGGNLILSGGQSASGNEGIVIITSPVSFIGPTTGMTYPLNFFIPDLITTGSNPNIVLHGMGVTDASTIQATGHIAYSTTAPVTIGITTYILRRIRPLILDTQIGTISFTNGIKEGVVTITDTSLLAGDIVQLINPATPDTAIDNITITLKTITI